MIAIALTLALTAPNPLATIHFDRIDVNHVIAKDGTERINQLIFWRWLRTEKRFVSFGYVMIRDDQQRPVRTDDGFVVEIKKHQRKWRVTAGCVIETWTINDPEMDDRAKYPEFEREWCDK